MENTTSDMSPEEFFLKNFNVDRLFHSIERADYLILYYIRACGEKSECETGVYLSELAEAMDIPIAQMSKAAKGLQEKGYIFWKMTDERDRTYVELTPNAIELMKEEHGLLRGVYEQIHLEIPEEELMNMGQTMRKITDIMKRASR